MIIPNTFGSFLQIFHKNINTINNLNNSSGGVSQQSSVSREEIVVNNAESLDDDFLPSIKPTVIGSGGRKSKQSQNKELSIISAVNQSRGGDMGNDDGDCSDEKEFSGPMPSSVPNFLVKTYEIVNDSANEQTV